MPERSTVHIPHNGDDSNGAYNTIRMLADIARQHENQARDMRLLAQHISAELAPIRGVFDPLRAHHTTDAWEGNAAITSRRRLDEHEGRYLNAIRALDTLIDDLEQEAAIAARAADLAHDDADAARRAAASLERTFEEFRMFPG